MFCDGGGAVTAGGGSHDFAIGAGAECAEIEAGPLADEPPKCDDVEIPGACHATPAVASPFALRDSSLALTTPYVKHPITMQISAPNNEIAKSNPNPRITV